MAFFISKFVEFFDTVSTQRLSLFIINDYSIIIVPFNR
jgi:hypothetical protein